MAASAAFTASRHWFISSHDGAVASASTPVSIARGRVRRHFQQQCSATASRVVDCLAIQLAEPSQFTQIARLRAEAYYEDDSSRFVETYKRKYVEQEVEALRLRTGQIPGKPPGVVLCECMVALQDGVNVVGCIDIRLPSAATGTQPMGLPLGDSGGCYLLNVVVREDVRGQGVGKALMREAMRRAVQQWGAEALYTRVDAQNEVAFKLYQGCGFEEHRVEARFEGTDVGRLLLLRAPASAVLGS